MKHRIFMLTSVHCSLHLRPQPQGCQVLGLCEEQNGHVRVERMIEPPKELFGITPIDHLYTVVRTCQPTHVGLEWI